MPRMNYILVSIPHEIKQHNMTTQQLKILQTQTAEPTKLDLGSIASTNIQTQKQQWADLAVTKHSQEQTDTALAHTSTLHTTKVPEN